MTTPTLSSNDLVTSVMTSSSVGDNSSTLTVVRDVDTVTQTILANQTWTVLNSSTLETSTAAMTNATVNETSALSSTTAAPTTPTR